MIQSKKVSDIYGAVSGEPIGLVCPYLISLALIILFIDNLLACFQVSYLNYLILFSPCIAHLLPSITVRLCDSLGV